MKYGKIIKDFVDDTFVPQTGFTIEESFAPEVVAMYQIIPDEVKTSWKLHADGTFSAPTPTTIPVESI